MAKYSGIVGFAEPVEVAAGVWDEKIVELPYKGDTFKQSRTLQSSTTSTNDNINISTQISIVADPYANMHFSTIRYVTYMGTKWKVTNVDVQHPRLVLSVGGLYNG